MTEGQVLDVGPGTSIGDDRIRPLEDPQYEQADLLQTGSDRTFLDQLRLTANHAAEIETLLQTIMVAVSHPEDWSDHDGTACLSSAGAERYLKHFPISFSQWKRQREDFTDSQGKGYRWRYECVAELWGRKVLAVGIYGTRDKFHGFANGQWRSLEEINENEIESGARHICIGNGVKTLLGLRGIPTTVLNRIFGAIGKNPDGVGIKSVQYGKGSQGGATTDEQSKRAELSRLLNEMVGPDPAAIKQAVERFTAFEGKDGKTHCRDSVARIKGKWLDTTLEKVRQAHQEWSGQTTNPAPASPGGATATSGTATDGIPF